MTWAEVWAKNWARFWKNFSVFRASPLKFLTASLPICHSMSCQDSCGWSLKTFISASFCALGHPTGFAAYQTLAQKRKVAFFGSWCAFLQFWVLEGVNKLRAGPRCAPKSVWNAYCQNFRHYSGKTKVHKLRTHEFSQKAVDSVTTSRLTRRRSVYVMGYQNSQGVLKGTNGYQAQMQIFADYCWFSPFLGKHSLPKESFKILFPNFLRFFFWPGKNTLENKRSATNKMFKVISIILVRREVISKNSIKRFLGFGKPRSLQETHRFLQETAERFAGTRRKPQIAVLTGLLATCPGVKRTLTRAKSWCAFSYPKSGPQLFWDASMHCSI